jgi:hypothetical protein
MFTAFAPDNMLKKASMAKAIARQSFLKLVIGAF